MVPRPPFLINISSLLLEFSLTRGKRMPNTRLSREACTCRGGPGSTLFVARPHSGYRPHALGCPLDGPLCLPEAGAQGGVELPAERGVRGDEVLNLGGGLRVGTSHAGGDAPRPDSVLWPHPGRWLGEGVRLRSRASPIVRDTVRSFCLQTRKGGLCRNRVQGP